MVDDDHKSYSLEELVELGVYTLAGKDEEGNSLYEFDADLAKEIAPDVWRKEIMKQDEHILKLIDDGYLEMDLEINPDTNELEVFYKILGDNDVEDD